MNTDSQMSLLSEEKTESESRPLPTPLGPRFQPLRAGLLNVWQYEDQELHFHRGRLILRGENGSGKSKALELLLPFLFDADLRPQRLDPFGGAGRSIRWNLLQNGKHKSRRGYVWLELGRFDGEQPVFITLGAGLHAGTAKSGVDAWYFITSQRVGEDLSLRDGRATKEIRQLREALGEEGRVFTRAMDYRERLDALLFRLGSERFQALRHLLLQLRRPQLSEKLDPSSLSDLLSESLPPLDEDLIQQLSEGFERLERDEEGLQQLRTAQEVTQRFLRVYRAYCRGIGVQRSREVSRCETLYHNARKLHRETEAAWEDVQGRWTEVLDRRAATEQRIAGARADLSALDSSEAMRAAKALQLEEENTRRLESMANDLRSDAERCRERVEEAQQEHDAAEESARAVEQTRRASMDRAAAAATDAALTATHQEAQERLEENAADHRRGVLATVDAVVDQKKHAVTELRRLIEQRDQAEQLFLRRDAQRREAEEQLRSAVERHEAAYGRSLRQRETLELELTAWSTGLQELSLAVLVSEAPPEDPPRTPEELLVEFWQELLDRDPERLAGTLADVLAPQQEALLQSLTEQRVEYQGTLDERAAQQAERERVAGLREIGPEPPPTRSASRQGRAGAPLYLLCDFAPHLTDAESAGLEAALEAAGLLDAWVSPDGQLLEADTLDTVLVPAPLEDVPTLADVLRPEPDAPVPSAVIEALLRSIALSPVLDQKAASRQTTSVDVDGGWRLGPLHGRWQKTAAEHIGMGARDAARRRRLADLDAAIAGLDGTLLEHRAVLLELETRLERLRAEHQAAPTVAGLRRELLRVDEAQGDAARRRDELSQAEATARKARDQHEHAVAELRRRANEVGLHAVLDDLTGYLGRVLDYRNLFTDFVSACVELQERTRYAEGLARRVETLKDEAEEVSRRAALGEREAFAAVSRLKTLRDSVGKDAEEIVAQHTAKSRELDDLEDLLSRLQEERDALTEKRARLDERRRSLGDDVENQDRARNAAGDRLKSLGRQNLLPLVLDSPPQDAVDAWTWSRTLEVAIRINQEYEKIDTEPAATDRRVDRLHRHYQELAGEMGSDYRPDHTHVDELFIVRVLYDRKAYGILDLVDMLAEQITRRRDMLAQDERQLFRDFFLGEVGDHLRRRLRAAEELTQEMNQLLKSCATASGLVYSLSWKPIEDVAENPQEILDLLYKAPEMLVEAERAQLEKFFGDRIDAARENGSISWREHLLTTLDYRAWHRFQVMVRAPGENRTTPLTSKRHAASSGGERAVALHLPLFAAAAAHYRSARDEAPRLILLDEAFAGIDPGMRGRCMGLLVEFDLDFMMTSYDEWGCYEELPGVATYQLYRDPTMDGVVAVRFVWNGERLAEDDP